MDASKASMAGPYRVGNEVLSVPAGFRMNGGYAHSASDCVQRFERWLPEKSFRAIAKDLGAVTAGKGTPEQVRRVVQTLIDSPVWKKFAPPAPTAKTTPEARKRELTVALRVMMWEFGVGMDCSGYVHHAFLAARGANTAAEKARYGLGDPLASGLQAPPPSVFRKVSPAETRAGDVLVLVNARDDRTGHKVMVYSHEIAKDGAVRSAAANALGSAPNARIHLFEVDSSWGAGTDAEAGGVLRKTWAWDESSGRWATVVSPDHNPWAKASKTPGPYDHDLQGIYRPRSES